jgi:hypothetical protein
MLPDKIVMDVATLFADVSEGLEIMSWNPAWGAVASICRMFTFVEDGTQEPNLSSFSPAPQPEDGEEATSSKPLNGQC